MTRTLLAACVAALASAAPAAAAPTQVDLSLAYDADVVVGHSGGNFDETNETMDGTFTYATQAAIEAANPGNCGSSVRTGLPDGGVFPSGGPDKPAVTLPIGDTQTGPNARQLADQASFTVATPESNFHEAIVFAAVANGPQTLRVTGQYLTGSEVEHRVATVPDWHFENQLAAGDYALIDNLDRINEGTLDCDDANDAGIYGLRIPLDRERTLDNLVLKAEVDPDTDPPVTIFAIVLRPVHQVTVAKAGSVGGTVTSSPAGITCGSDCSGFFNEFSSVTLNAIPESGAAFTGWSGACGGTGSCTLSNLTEDEDVTATFGPKPPSDTPPGETPPPDTPPPTNPFVPPAPGPLPPTTTATPTTTNVRFNSIAAAPSRRGCASRRRRLRVRVAAPAGTTLQSATVTIGGRSRTTTGTGVTFRRVPRGAFTITVEVKTTDGRTLRATKRYRRCRRARRRAS
jgi:hypothetical protein